MSDKGTDGHGIPPTEEDFTMVKDRLNPTLPDKSDNYTEEGIKSEEEWFRLARGTDQTPSPTESDFARAQAMANQQTNWSEYGSDKAQRDKEEELRT